MTIGSLRQVKHFPKKGFTLVELMIVVVIIGLLAAIGIPRFTKSRRNANAARMAGDFRQFGDKFHLQYLSEGTWPDDNLPMGIPPGMESALANSSWGNQTAIGGYWDFDAGVFGVIAGVSIDQATADTETMRAIDVLIDDGDLNSGYLRLLNSNRLTLILEE